MRELCHRELSRWGPVVCSLIERDMLRKSSHENVTENENDARDRAVANRRPDNVKRCGKRRRGVIRLQIQMQVVQSSCVGQRWTDHGTL
eukprot:3298852-Prymnesium_polylepis.1